MRPHCNPHAWQYLSKFKWDYLTEKLAYERRVREAKLKVRASHGVDRPTDPAGQRLESVCVCEM